MTTRRQLLFAIVLLAAVPAGAHFGIFKNKEKFPVHHPPTVKLPATVSVRIEPPRHADIIYDQLATLLTPRGIDIGSSDMEIVITVTRFDADVRDVHLPRRISVHTGDKTESDSKGRTKTTPICKSMDARLRQRQWKGDISMILQVRDHVSSGATLLSEPINDAYYKDALLSGPDVRGCESWTYGVPQDAPRGPEGVAELLAERAVAMAGNHLLGWTEIRDALLAVCDELKPGNAKAKAGDLQGAMESWQAARPKENAPEKISHLHAYRQYNIAVAMMLLASGEPDPAQAQAQLDEAWKRFENARAAQPGEKYFSSPNEFPADFAAVRQVVDRAAADAAEQKRQRQEAERPAAMSNKWLHQPLDPAVFPGDESGDVARFRRIARERLALLTEPEQGDEPAVAAELDRYAKRIGVVPEDQAKVTEDEKARWQAVLAALHDYDVALKRVLQGRTNVRVSAEEAKRLDLELETLQLTPPMVAPLEAKRGISRSAPASTPARRKP